MDKKMNIKKSSKRIFMTSIWALVLCVAMFIGTTFAWFTDNVSNSGNIIKTGNLDLEMYWTDDLDSGEWHNVEDDEYNTIFKHDNWEPGYTEVKYIKLVNKGNLALNYNVTLSPQGIVGKLADVINVYFVNGVTENINSRTDLQNHVAAGLLKDVINGGKVAEGSLLPSGEISPFHDSGSTIVAIAMTMLTSADNKYQEETIGDGFSIKALATQCAFEEDSFGDNYDMAKGIVAVNGSIPTGGLTISTTSGVSAYIPEGVILEEETKKLELTIIPKNESDSNITVINQEILSAFDVHIDGISEDNTVPMIINLGTLLPSGLNFGSYTLSHVENGATNVMTYVNSVDELNAHNQFTYNPVSGEVIVSMATFSEVAVVVDQENPWDGTRSYLWYNNAGGVSASEYIISNADELAGFGDIVSGIATGIAQDSFQGKTIKLAADINLKPDSEPDRYNKNNLNFYPIGYAGTIDGENSSIIRTNADGETEIITTGAYGGAFCGTFDGTGHSISNLTQNGWSMYSELYYDGYYNEAMGLFGYVYDGTVKNLTLNDFSMVMEFAPMGCVTAYAGGTSKFENIALFDCNPQTYNTGVAGIVGWDDGGKTADKASDYSFKNITVDKSNTITALWGSWDVAAGGIMGQLGQYSEATFENCHVSAILDVYNDVCANYQYYWYRYCGMMIGTVRNHKTENGYTVPNLENITATNCSVTYDDWNDYYYCELVENTQASYTDDHQFSRLSPLGSTGHNRLIQDSEGNLTCYHEINGVVHTHAKTDANGNIIEDKTMVNLPFHQLFTGYGWGVKAVEAFDGIVVYKTAENGGRLEAREKFGVKDLLSTVYTGDTIKIGDLFEALTEDIADAAVQVAVTALDNSNVTATYTVNDSLNWWENTLAFEGQGNVEITIQDYYYCTPTTIQLKVEEPENVDKFDICFENTDKYLYRVGNKNAVEIGSLFTELENVTIDDSSVHVTIDKYNDNSNVIATFTANTSDWTKGTIQFSGTGVIEVTIQDDDYCVPTTLYLEIVDATNLTSATGTTTGGNFVLLCDVNTSDYVYYWNCSLYGNGFTYSLNGAPTNYSSSHGHGVLMTKNTTLDNLVIVGDVYDEYGAYTTNNDYNAAIDIMGDTIIQNCYISGCSAPISTRANATITNTTLYGGAVGNLIIKGGTVTLENVTTVNYDDGRTLVGMGIVAHSDASEESKLVLNGTLTQYNFICENKTPSNTYAKNLHNAMFSDSCSQYHFGTNPNRYVNTGIISLATNFDNSDITDNAKTGYVGQSVSASGFNGYVYTQPNTSGTVNNNYDKNTDSNVATEQGVVPPSYSFDYVTKNYAAKTDGSNDYCCLENGIVKISMDDGDTFNWDTSILTVTKGNQTLDYTVSMNDTDYTGKSITFNTAGDYKVLYTYTDPNNYKLDENGNITTYSKTYTKTVNISVAVIKSTTKHAEFTMGSSNAPTEKITVGTATYISATNVTADNSTWTYITIDGQKIYYPIVAAKLTSTKGSSTYAYFPVFENVVTITDYADNGTGAAFTYDSSTTTLPSTLTAVKGIYKAASDVPYWYNLTDSNLTQSGASKIFKWASSSDAPSDPTAYKNVLCYKSPQVSADRVAYITLVQYSYTDATNTTYYYYVGYTLEAFTKQTTCVTPDTLVTLADGNQKEIQEVTYDDKLLVWDFLKGEYKAVPSSIIMNHGYGQYKVLTLNFEDGTKVNTINGHGFYDAMMNRFVILQESNVKDYIGHNFVKQAGENKIVTKLVSYNISEEYTESWSILSTQHYNCILEGMLTLTPAEVDGSPKYLMPYEVAEDMKYDEKKMEADIKKYGLYGYEVFEEYITYDQYMDLNLANFKVSVEKGYITWNEILYLLNIHIK